MNSQYIIFDVSSNSYRKHETIEITNNSDQTKLFKILTNARQRYIVKPNCGIIKPGAREKVEILLSLMDDEKDKTGMKDKFAIYFLNSDEVFETKQKLDDYISVNKQKAERVIVISQIGRDNNSMKESIDLSEFNRDSKNFQSMTQNNDFSFKESQEIRRSALPTLINNEKSNVIRNSPFPEQKSKNEHFLPKLNLIKSEIPPTQQNVKQEDANHKTENSKDQEIIRRLVSQINVTENELDLLRVILIEETAG